MRFTLDDTPVLQMQLNQFRPPAYQTLREDCVVHYDGELVVYDLSIRLEGHEAVEDDIISVYLNFSSMENLVLVGAEPLSFCKQPTTDVTFEDTVYKIQLRKQDSFQTKLQAVLHCRSDCAQQFCVVARYSVGEYPMRTVAYQHKFVVERVVTLNASTAELMELGPLFDAIKQQNVHNLAK